MTFAPFGRIELEPLYEYLKVLTIKEVFSLETGKFMYKKTNNLPPISIGDYFESRQRKDSGYNLRPRKNNLTNLLCTDLLPVNVRFNFTGQIFGKPYRMK